MRLIRTVVVLLLCTYVNLFAGGPVPTDPQLVYSQMEIGAIIHFNMATAAGTQG